MLRLLEYLTSYPQFKIDLLITKYGEIIDATSSLL